MHVLVPVCIKIYSYTRKENDIFYAINVELVKGRWSIVGGSEQIGFNRYCSFESKCHGDISSLGCSTLPPLYLSF